jgi:hypothetical protein
MLGHASAVGPEEIRERQLGGLTRGRCLALGEESGPVNVPANLASTVTVSSDSRTVCTTMWASGRARRKASA